MVDTRYYCNWLPSDRDETRVRTFNTGIAFIRRVTVSGFSHEPLPGVYYPMPFLHVSLHQITEPAWRFPALLVRPIPCPSMSRPRYPYSSHHLRVLSSSPVQQKLGLRATQRHFCHSIFCSSPSTSAQCTQEQDKNSSWHDYESEGEKERTKRTKKPAKEIMVAADDEDEGEGEGEKEKANLPKSLDRALARAFSLNSANPNVAASCQPQQAQGQPVASGSTRPLRRMTGTKSSISMEVVIASPTKPLRTQVLKGKPEPE